MLVLSRKVGESISIGTEVIIRIIRVSGNQVRVGIDAPSWVRLVRSELQAPRNTPTAETHCLDR
jgi:carbon storage regulator